MKSVSTVCLNLSISHLTVAVLVEALDEYLLSLLSGKDLPAEVAPRVSVGQVGLHVAVVQLRGETLVEDYQFVLKGRHPHWLHWCLHQDM